MNTTTFFSRLGDILGPNGLLTSPDDLAAYGSDWTRLPSKPLAVALPKSTEMIRDILRLCSTEKIAVVPSGGRTGLAGGAVAQKGELVLSLNRMNRIEAIDMAGYSVRVQAGATTQSVHEHCAKVGLTWPIDLAAKGSSQIGGNLSTNAGGLRVVRYGMTRKWVSAIQAVTMSGEILELNRNLEKNNTGYDLLQLLIGSEGTLAVLTEATLKLTRLPQNSSVFLFTVDTVEHLQELFLKSRRGPFEILACEFFSRMCLTAVEKILGRKSRLKKQADFNLIIEIEPLASAGIDGIHSWLNEVLDSSIVADGLLAESSEDKRATWELREGITESLSRLGAVRKYDIAVPVNETVRFLKEAQYLPKHLGLHFDLYLFGHLGDGSPHLNLVQPPLMTPDTFQKEGDRFEEALFPLVKSFSGSISAEHGVGLLKKHWVTYSRSPEELRLYSAIKQAFDPEGLLNPGKLVPQ